MSSKVLLLVTLILLSQLGAAMDNKEKAIEIFNKLDKNHLDLVEQFYDKEVQFEDPVHSLKGSKAVESYYAKLYKDVESIHFDFSKTISEGDTVVLVWKMFLKAPALNAGKEFSVSGASVITFGGSEGKAIAHRDYFDMGEFVYERIPVLRSVIGVVKSKLAD